MKGRTGVLSERVAGDENGEKRIFRLWQPARREEQKADAFPKLSGWKKYTRQG